MIRLIDDVRPLAAVPSATARTAPTAGAAARLDDLFGPVDQHLFAEGTHARLGELLGAHRLPGDRTRFGVWAPHAESVSVVGDWNGWDAAVHPMTRQAREGIWTTTVEGARPGQAYKFRITGPHATYTADKADPFARWSERPPATASRLWESSHQWHDGEWMATRARHADPGAPMAVYEVHLGSWRRDGEGNPLTYRELAPLLARHVQALGFTHVEVMPVTEHPFYGSWGYQTTGYFGPTARYGTPDDFKFFVDHLHQCGIGVLLDWVPSHFPTDEHGLQYFDGTHLFEHADPRRGFHPHWQSSIFDYGRGQVRSFLISSACHWIETFHLDGLRVDAVASMLYLDYGRDAGEWVPNRHGGKESIEAIAFVRALNEALKREHPDVLCIAEESTAWPGVSRPTEQGGLGFSMKWNMGWMNDTLAFMKLDPVHRKYHLGKLAFSLVYAFDERFVLPLSHDEVVHGKGSLLSKMPGDRWQQFANLRLLLAWMWAHPGKKLLFMGGEFGQRREWGHDGALDWHLLDEPEHAGIQKLVAQMNCLLRASPALHALDASRDGFEWIESNDEVNSVIAFLRKAGDQAPALLAVFNFTPVPRTHHVVGVPVGGEWHEVLNSDARDYAGSGWGNGGKVQATPRPSHGMPHSVSLTLPPLSALWLMPAAQAIAEPTDAGLAAQAPARET